MCVINWMRHLRKILFLGSDLNIHSRPRRQETPKLVPALLLTLHDHGQTNESLSTSGSSFVKWQSQTRWFLRSICNLLCCNFFFIIDIHCDLQRDENFEQSFWFKVCVQKCCSSGLVNTNEGIQIFHRMSSNDYQDLLSPELQVQEYSFSDPWLILQGDHG